LRSTKFLKLPRIRPLPINENFSFIIFPPCNSTGATTGSFPVSIVSYLKYKCIEFTSTSGCPWLRERVAVKQAIPGQVNSRLFELARVQVGFDHAASTIVNLVYCAMSSTAMLRVVDYVPGVDVPLSDRTGARRY
jgi:hypothetical protein